MLRVARPRETKATWKWKLSFSLNALTLGNALALEIQLVLLFGVFQKLVEMNLMEQAFRCDWMTEW